MDPYGSVHYDEKSYGIQEDPQTPRSTTSNSIDSSGGSSYNPNQVVYSATNSNSSGRDIYSIDGDSKVQFVSDLEQENCWSDLFINGLKDIENSYLSQEITNWNELFQTVLDLPDSEDKFQKLASIANDFVYCADTFGKIIISELHTPDHLKTIKPLDIGGVAGGSKYMIQNIIFKFAKDTEIREGIWMYGGNHPSDHYAQKSANHEIKGLNHFMEISNGGLIRFPLMAIIDYRGYRLLAISHLPINKNTIVYGSCDGGKVVHNSNPDVAKEMERIAKLLNLRGHTVGLTQTFIYGPGDIEVHQGTDKRFYMVDFARIFPPEYPLVFQNNKDKIGREIFYLMLRPELVVRSPTPLSSDAFSGWQTSMFEENLNGDIVKITKHLHTDIIEQAVNVLNSKEEIDYSPATHKVAEILKMVNILNSQGVNNRYLGVIGSQLKVKCMKELLLSEVAARVWKRVIRSKLRRIMDITKRPSEEPYKVLIAEAFSLILKNNREQIDFWSSMEPGSFKHIALKIFPRSLSESDMNPDVDLRSNLDVKVIILRLLKMLNIKLNDSSLNQFLSPEEYVLGVQDMLEVGSTVKYPYIIDYSHGSDLLTQTQKIIKTPKPNPLEIDRWVDNAKCKLYEAIRQMPGSFKVLIKLLTALHIKSSVETDIKSATQSLIIGIIMGSWNIKLENQKNSSLHGLIGLFHLSLATIYLFYSNFVDQFERELSYAKKHLEQALEGDPNCLDEYIHQTLPISNDIAPCKLDKNSENYQKRKVYHLLSLTYLLTKVPANSPLNLHFPKYIKNVIQIDNFEILSYAEPHINCKVVTTFFRNLSNQLLSLSIRKLNFSPYISNSISQLSKLTGLGLYDVKPHDSDKSFNKFFKDIFENCKGLDRFAVVDNKYVNDETFEGLHHHFSRLEILWLSKLPLITNKTLVSLSPHVKKLKRLFFINLDFTDNDVCTFLESIEELEDLYLDSLPLLTNYTAMFIVQNQLNLKNLSLDSSGFTKECILDVGKLLINLKKFIKPDFILAPPYKMKSIENFPDPIYSNDYN